MILFKAIPTRAAKIAEVMIITIAAFFSSPNVYSAPEQLNQSASERRANSLASAESSDEATVIVSATRTPLFLKEALSDVTVVNRADIERSGSRSLPELLSQQVGVQISTTGGPGTDTGFFLRGTNSNHTLTLLNGQRISSVLNGSAPLSNIPIDQIERIEILRGPASSLYGADALGGVLLITTRQNTGKPAANFSVGGGSHRSAGVEAGIGGTAAATTFQIQTSAERSAGFPTLKGPLGGSSEMYNPNSGAYNNQSFSGHLAHHLNDRIEIGTDLFFTDGVKHISSSNCDKSYVQCTPKFDNRSETKVTTVSTFLNAEILQNWLSSLRLGQSENRDLSRRLDPSVPEMHNDKFNSNESSFAWQNDFQIAGISWFSAAEFRQVRVDSTQDFTRHKRNNRSITLGAQKWLGDHGLQGSARSDNTDGFDDNKTGTLAYGYKLTDNWIARISYGTAFHAPTFNDLYWTLDTTNYYQGNALLNPERAHNREVGLQYDDNVLHWGISAYRNSVRDLIQYVPGTASNNYIGTVGNIGQVTLKGAGMNFQRKGKAWTYHVNMDYLSAVNDETNLFLPRRAARTALIGATRNWGTYTFGIDFFASSARYEDAKNTLRMGGYGTFKLTSVYHINRTWQIEANIGNVLDKNYALAIAGFAPNTQDYAVAGRTFWLNVRYAQ